MNYFPEIHPPGTFLHAISIWRFYLKVAAVAGLLLTGFQPPVHAADEGWEDYQRRIELTRKESERRYEKWLGEQDKENQTWRDTKGTGQDRVVEVPNSGLKPGRYTLRLPFGVDVRLDVPNDARVPKAQPAWDHRSYGDVYQRARQISDHLRELHLGLQRAGHSELAAEAARIFELGASIANAAATRRSAAEVRTQFTEFDRLWHPFVHRLSRQTEVGASLQRRVSVVDQLEDVLHQILAISPAPPYNRRLVIALTSELQQTTSTLLKDLRIEPQRTLDLHTITLWAHRVKQHATDLAATVGQNAPLATIVEEYEEFDRAWHRLLQQARISSDVDARVRRIARHVRQVDLQLHKELYVNVPTVSDRQQLLHLSAGIAKSADHLADELDAHAGRAKRDLVDEARLFVFIARDLNGTLTDRSSAQAEQRAVKEFLDSWRPLIAQINALNGDRFADSQAIAARLVADIQRLETQWRGR